MTRLDGGLGNQMFQYAVGRALSLGCGVPLYLDATVYRSYTSRQYTLGVFDVKAEIYSARKAALLKFAPLEAGGRIIGKLARKLPSDVITMVKRILAERASGRQKHAPPHGSGHYRREKEKYAFDETILSIQPPVYLDGYWQNENYFVHHRTEILRDFELKVPISEKAAEYKRMIVQTAPASVSLHIRRGDYVQSREARKLYDGICDLDYYDRALQMLNSAVPEPSIFVFSDDLAWARAHLRFERMIFVEGCLDYEEMFLMSCCQHNIIANSSFSWWGAWLNANKEKIVIGPRRWHKSGSNLFTPLPENWRRV